MQRATVPCRACSAELPADARKCDRCGVLQRDDVRCPHCGAVADAAPHPELVFACEACGGPRVPQDDPARRGAGGEVPALRTAEAARRSRAGWTAVGFAAGALLAVGLGTVGAAALLFGAGLKLGVAAAVLAAPVVLLLATAVRRVSASTAAIRPAIDLAWQTAATELAGAAPGPFAAADLARALRVDESRAEELLALLDATDVIRGDVDEHGELRFRPTLAPRVRIDAGAEPGGPTTLDAEAEHEAAEHEAAAQEQPAAEARARKGEV